MLKCCQFLSVYINHLLTGLFFRLPWLLVSEIIWSGAMIAMRPGHSDQQQTPQGGNTKDLPSPRTWPLFRSFLIFFLVLFPRPFRAPAPLLARTPFHSSSAVTAKGQSRTGNDITLITNRQETVVAMTTRNNSYMDDIFLNIVKSGIYINKMHDTLKFPCKRLSRGSVRCHRLWSEGKTSWMTKWCPLNKALNCSRDWLTLPSQMYVTLNRSVC